MSRFRYPLQCALDHAVACERAERMRLADAQNTLDEHRAALERLRAQAAATRNDVVRTGAVRGSAYVEVGLRLAAIGGAARERGAHLAHGAAAVELAREKLEVVSQRRRAIERHRDRARERFAAEAALREAADFDESNASRGCAEACR